MSDINSSPPQRVPLPPDDPQRDPDVSRAYRDAVADDRGPSSALDAGILAAAHRAARARPQSIKRSWTQRWTAPLALAASALLAVGIAWHVNDVEEQTHRRTDMRWPSEQVTPAQGEATARAKPGQTENLTGGNTDNERDTGKLAKKAKQPGQNARDQVSTTAGAAEANRGLTTSAPVVTGATGRPDVTGPTGATAPPLAAPVPAPSSTPTPVERAVRQETAKLEDGVELRAARPAPSPAPAPAPAAANPPGPEAEPRFTPDPRAPSDAARVPASPPAPAQPAPPVSVSPRADIAAAGAGTGASAAAGASGSGGAGAGAGVSTGASTDARELGNDVRGRIAERRSAGAPGSATALRRSAVEESADVTFERMRELRRIGQVDEARKLAVELRARAPSVAFPDDLRDLLPRE